MTGKSTDKGNCKRYRALIDKRLDREITTSENQELDSHLEDCPACRDEMASFEVVETLLNEVAAEPVEVPDGLFESLENKLDEVKPARGLSGILGSPFFAQHRTRALAMASIVLVMVLTVGVARGITDRLEQTDAMKFADAPSKALIQTNAGDTFILSGDEGDPDRYSEALDDLEQAYLEALGEENSEDAEGYIHTSWSGGEAATPIH